jgi:hypothetical protein
LVACCGAAAGVALPVFFGPHAPDSRAKARVIAETVVAAFAGLIAAYELSPTVAHWLGLHDARDLAAVGFVLGVVFWRLLPPLISIASLSCLSRPGSPEEIVFFSHGPRSLTREAGDLCITFLMEICYNCARGSSCTALVGVRIVSFPSHEKYSRADVWLGVSST